MDPNLLSLEFDRVLTMVSLRARTTLGREAVASIRPVNRLDECEHRQARLAEMVRYYLHEGPLPFGGITDVRFLLEGEKGLELHDSWQILRAVRGTQALREATTRTEDRYPLLRAEGETIEDLEPVVQSVGRYFTRDGKLREEASGELRSLKTRIGEKRRSIQRSLFDLMERQADAIQEPIVTIRGERYCIPVRTDHRTSVPGILHERSGSGASMFIEPMQVVEMNNDLADLLIQEREEIARITRHIANQLIEAADSILGALTVAANLDALQACAIVQDSAGGIRPRFSEERDFRIVEGRHPLIDERLADLRREAFGDDSAPDHVIPTTFDLSEETTAIVISGPNAGGKTVALKTAGLLAAMASAGLPVPAADGTVIPVVDRLHVLIGDDQNVLEHLSTFSAYLTRLKRVLMNATDRSLVLLDELGSGTDPEEGAALAASVIEHILDTGALLIATTHLSVLKTFAITDRRITNAAMQFDASSGRPTFRMVVGVPGRSRAIDVAEMIGLPRTITDAARSRLGDRYGDIDRLLAELQTRLVLIVEEEERLRVARVEAESQGATLRSEREALEKERKVLVRNLRDEIERIKTDVSTQLRTELRHLREMDRKSREQSRADEAYERIVKPLAAIASIDAPPRTVAVGERAEHRRFHTVGQVMSIDGARARLAVGGKTIEVELSDLAPAEQSASGQQRRTSPAPSPAVQAASEPSISAELNLIGTRVDDALEEMDKFLDRALMEGRGAVRLIHGFGTGALRKAVRDHLRKHPAVRSWRGGGDREGGDGATVAILDV
jgi:DNA mismatch repair protein MutS2